MVTKASDRECSKCGGDTYVIVRNGDYAQAQVCTCSAQCSLCEGRGYSYQVHEATFSTKVGAKRYEVLVPCACQLRAQSIAQFNAVGLPAVVAHVAFENYLPKVPAQTTALDVAYTFAHSYKKDGVNKGFILSGPVGSGKTHLLAATLKHLVLNLGVHARYVEISLLYANIRRGFQQGKSGGEIIGPLSEIPVLAIDELGKGRGSQFEMDTLDELISRRYNAGRTTLFATNFSLELERKNAWAASPNGYRSTEDTKAAVREAELLRERVTERIFSRLCEICTFVEFPRDPELDDRRKRQEKTDRHSSPTAGGTRKGR